MASGGAGVAIGAGTVMALLNRCAGKVMALLGCIGAGLTSTRHGTKYRSWSCAASISYFSSSSSHSNPSGVGVNDAGMCFSSSVHKW